MDRIIEAYVGEYASGKSEFAINRALELNAQGRKVKLVDLDLVDPFFTLRPIKKELESKGLEVVARDSREIVGLGETGYPISPQAKWALTGSSDVILDVGYGTDGVRTLNLLGRGTEREKIKIFVVVNVARPMTADTKDIVDYVRSMGKVDGLINNSHLGQETNRDIIREGEQVVSRAAEELGIPLIATAVAREFAVLLDRCDDINSPVRVLDLFMGNAYW